MKRFSQQLKNAAERTSLSASEKRELRERIISYMEYHPLPTSVGVSLRAQPEGVRYIPFLNIVKWGTSVTAVAFLAVFFIAEQSIPGDTLYAIKVRFNEEVRGTLAITPYEKVVWETERLNRRIAEARLLASEGKLTPETEAEVAKAVRTHSDNARREIAVLKETDSDEAAIASIELSTALSVQTTSLRNLAETETVNTNQIDIVLAATTEAVAQEEEETLPAYGPLSARVEQSTTRAYELLESVAVRATETEKTDIRRRLSDIESKIVIATEAYVPENDTDARVQLVEVLHQIQKLIVFMTNIDVRSSVTVDEIVPVTLTEAERRAAITAAITEVQTNLAFLVSLQSASSSETIDAAVTEKIAFAITTATTNLEELTVQFNDGTTTLEILEQKAVSAVSLTKDARTLLETTIGTADVDTKLDETATSTEPVVSDEIDTIDVGLEGSATTTQEASVE